MKRVATAILLMMAAVTTTTKASDTKVGGRLYTDWRMDLTDGADNANSFNVTRTYIDVKSKLSGQASVRFTLDLREINGFDGYNIILKYGFLDWHPDFMKSYAKLRFGQQPTPYIDQANKLWGRRYLEKTPSDKYKFLTSADLGANVYVALGEKSKYGTVGVGLYNGTSYTDVTDQNKQKDISTYLQLNPLVNVPDFSRSQLIAQYYTGTQNVSIDSTMDSGDYDKQLASVSGLLDYRHTVAAGFDLNFLSLGQGMGAPDLSKTAHSFFGTLYLSGLAPEQDILNTMNLFGRIDLVDPNTDVDNDGSTLIIVGAECNMVKGFKMAVNYRSLSFEDDTKDTKSYLYLNWLVKI